MPRGSRRHSERQENPPRVEHDVDTQDSEQTQHPDEWSEWAWDGKKGYWCRYKEVGGKLILDYDYEHPPEDYAPNISGPSAPTGYLPTSTPAKQSYGIANITRGMASTTLGYSQSSQQGEDRELESSYGASSIASLPQPASQLQPPIKRSVHPANTKTKHGELNRNFKVHRSKDFKFGRVFKVLWSEPAGAYGTHITVAKHGEDAHHKVRRFLIIRERKGHSTCLPILTYQSQGLLKNGVHSEHHAAIYSTRKYTLRRDEQPGHNAIKMEVIDPVHNLDSMSRLNYAKVYTVEHNVKVFFIGHIHKDYLQQVVTDFNIWNGSLPPVEPNSMNKIGEAVHDVSDYGDGGGGGKGGGRGGRGNTSYEQGYVNAQQSQAYASNSTTQDYFQPPYVAPGACFESLTENQNQNQRNDRQVFRSHIYESDTHLVDPGYDISTSPGNNNRIVGEIPRRDWGEDSSTVGPGTSTASYPGNVVVAPRYTLATQQTEQGIQPGGLYTEEDEEDIYNR